MSSSKYSRRPRPQQPPAICKRPPIPEPPNTPIASLQALVSWHGEDFSGNAIALDRTINLVPIALPVGNDYGGFSYPPPADFNLILWRNNEHDPFLVTLQLYESGMLTDQVQARIDENPAFPPALGTVCFEPGDRRYTCITALIFL